MDPEAYKPDDALISSLADDPDMAELVRIYVGKLPAAELDLEHAWARRDLVELGRYAHILTDATFYGFPTIAMAAHELESSIRQHADSSEVGRQVDGVLALCRRAHRAPSPTTS